MDLGRYDSLTRTLPLLDDEYPTDLLLSAVAAMRFVRASNRGVPIDRAEIPSLFQPYRALMISCAVLEMDPPAMPEITPEERDQVVFAIERIVGTMPPWERFFSLPIRYLKLPQDYNAISGSAQKWPQHILLGDVALTASEIEEQLIHEFCHQWQYLIQEIFPSNVKSRDRTLTLPSGTSERAPSEVLGAAHVAATLCKYYGMVDAVEQITPLRQYSLGCISILQEHGDRLTDTGKRLLRHVATYMEGRP